MKREALKHPKTLELAAQLGVSVPAAIGHLELLIDYCADVAPQGNIGKWSNAVIAQAAMWPIEKADQFIDALVVSGWLDEDLEYRLIIHDLTDHAPNWWHAKLKKLGLSFLDGSKKPLRRGQEPSIEAAIQQTSSQQTSSNLSKPPASPSKTADDEDDLDGQEIPVEAVEEIALEVFTQSRHTKQDAEIFWKAAGIVVAFPGYLNRAQLCDAARRCRGKGNPPGYFRETMREMCGDFDKLIKKIQVVPGWPAGPPKRSSSEKISNIMLRSPPKANPGRSNPDIEAQLRAIGAN